MDGVLTWGVELILLIQHNRTALLDEFFRAITTLGGQGHLYIVPFVIWCLGYRAGSRMLLTLLLSAFVNFALDVDGKISEAGMQAISPNTDFSFDFHDLTLKPVAGSQ